MPKKINTEKPTPTYIILIAINLKIAIVEQRRVAKHNNDVVLDKNG